MFPVFAVAEPPAAETPSAVGPIPPAGQQLSPITLGPPWLRKPTGDQLLRNYPFVARQRNLSGSAAIGCGVDATGKLVDCKILGETPEGAGFGDAALRLAQYFQMQPTLKDGKPVAGGQVRIPIRFTAPTGMDLRRPNFEGVFACYGQTANRAESDPTSDNWRAAIYWSLQVQGMIAADFGRPSDAEALERQSRLAAAGGSLKIPRGFAESDCLEAAAKATKSK